MTFYFSKIIDRFAYARLFLQVSPCAFVLVSFRETFRQAITPRQIERSGRKTTKKVQKHPSKTTQKILT
jgi:hypothetical protein